MQTTNFEALTKKQFDFLLKLGEEEEKIKTLSKKEASRKIGLLLHEQRKAKEEMQNQDKQEDVFFTFTDFQEYKNLYYKKYYNYYKEKDFDKQFQYAVKIENYFIIIDYQSIKTHFCFGYGQNGVSTQEEINSAYEEEENANSNENYFIQENMRNVNANIEELEEALTSFKDYEKLALISNYRDNIKCDFTKVINYDGIYYDEHHYKQNVLKILTVEEIQKILSAYKQVKADFEKRLNAYLKRYGLSKLKTWTYLVD